MSEAWLGLFVVANAIQFVFGAAITGLSYSAYRATRKRAFRYSTIGFLLITVGGVSAPLYEFGIKGDYDISARELLELQVMEGVLLGLGLAFLLVSIYGHSSTTTQVDTDPQREWHDLEREENS